jgi:hypothetical protein
MIIVSLAEARQRGLKRYFTGLPCVHGHIAERLIANQTCAECQKTMASTRRYQKSDKHKAAKKRDYIKHKKKRLAQQYDWVTRNLDRVKWNKHQHYLANDHIYKAHSAISKLR